MPAGRKVSQYGHKKVAKVPADMRGGRTAAGSSSPAKDKVEEFLASGDNSWLVFDKTNTVKPLSIASALIKVVKRPEYKERVRTCVRTTRVEGKEPVVKVYLERK